MDCPTPTQEQLDRIEGKMQVLIDEAIALGIAVTVTNEPIEPLSMGNKVPVIEVVSMTQTHYNKIIDLSWAEDKRGCV